MVNSEERNKITLKSGVTVDIDLKELFRCYKPLGDVIRKHVEKTNS